VKSAELPFQISAGNFRQETRKDDRLVNAMNGLLELRLNRHQLKKTTEQLDLYVGELNRLIKNLPAETSVKSREDIIKSRDRFVSLIDQ
jgi:hypothetical protein